MRNTLVELHGIRAIGSNSRFVLGSQNKSDLVVSLPSEGEARCQDQPVPEVRRPEAERMKLTRRRVEERSSFFWPPTNSIGVAIPFSGQGDLVLGLWDSALGTRRRSSSFPLTDQIYQICHHCNQNFSLRSLISSLRRKI